MSTAATASSLSTATSPWDHPVTSPRRQKSGGAPTTRPPATPSVIAPSIVTATSPGLRIPSGAGSPPSAPSPNYFALGPDPAQHRTSGSPAALQATPAFIHAVAAMSPQLVRADPRSEFETFRRQSDPRTITLGPIQRTSASRKISTPAGLRSGAGLNASKTARAMAPPPRSTDPMDLDSDPVQKMEISDADVLGGPRYDSPANFPNAKAAPAAPPSRPSMDDHHHHHARLSMPSIRPVLPSPTASQEHHHPTARAATLPPRPTSSGITLITPSDLAALLTSKQNVFLLDVRVNQQFARARISGALNLCIPSTLLKRPSYNLRKLADTFTDPAMKARFDAGRNAGMIVVYDDRSSSEKDAIACVCTLKKFTNEGWNGQACMLRGGFATFSKQYPQLVGEGGVSAGPATSKSNLLSLQGGSVPAAAPLAGGCPMPTGQPAANAFFGNIRQNTDLIGGVGQIRVRRPSDLSRERASNIPRWLATATDESNQGRAIADRFLQIERDEQRRMQEALSGGVGENNVTTSDILRQVTIAGIEEGTKNRYNNIWPYDHARVKLQDRSDGSCDYINASHIKVPWSNKRYIATQGPMPATFRDFWNLVWEQDVRVIVMLTAESEGGQLKCHPYWTGREFGPLRLKPISERRVSLEPSKAGQILSHQPQRRSSSKVQHDGGGGGGGGMLSPLSPTSPSSINNPTPEPVHAVVRTFSLSHASHPFMPIREITQLQLASWLDFDAPAHPAHVLNLIEQCDAVVRASMPPTMTSPRYSQQHQQQQQQQQHHLLPFPAHPRPVLVHCSAGCGRTGTFCTIDSVLDMLRRQKIERERLKSGGGGSSSRRKNSINISIPSPTAPPPLDPPPIPSTDANNSDQSKGDEDRERAKEWIFNDNIDLIAQTVDHLRSQRISMVQSLRQYVLCYEAILEWLGEQESPFPLMTGSSSST
ncbi:MAG: hypothetical protein M1823_002400 [Watsoniomyces obsoletus]|nr:MAG: hypothetical protein M1823_002400 [Watsoniomyces obsoletus]